ncbi:hypothetical protein MPH_06459 [Macrophomina phaseolina MS6]|uniref:Uncharacterized protein n=1 Tax=Macrophomina phaseolina (strain MS6) TaxID=1126212 RepID=K2RUC1_MACPH|nr:hypothetical protein MPH_06459 [Macrophomina phaseolina MS6]
MSRTSSSRDTTLDGPRSPSDIQRIAEGRQVVGIAGEWLTMEPEQMEQHDVVPTADPSFVPALRPIPNTDFDPVRGLSNPTRKEKKIVKSALVPFGGRVERDGPIIQQLNSHLSRENPKLNDRALTDLTVLGMRYIVRNRMLQAGRGPLAKDDFSDLDYASRFLPGMSDCSDTAESEDEAWLVDELRKAQLLQLLRHYDRYASSNGVRSMSTSTSAFDASRRKTRSRDASVYSTPEYPFAHQSQRAGQTVGRRAHTVDADVGGFTAEHSRRQRDILPALNQPYSPRQEQLRDSSESAKTVDVDDGQEARPEDKTRRSLLEARDNRVAEGERASNISRGRSSGRKKKDRKGSFFGLCCFS